MGGGSGRLGPREGAVRRTGGQFGDGTTSGRGLFGGTFPGGGSFREYDAAPDDQHFVMVSGGAAQSTLYGMQNVFPRLRYDRNR